MPAAKALAFTGEDLARLHPKTSHSNGLDGVCLCDFLVIIAATFAFKFQVMPFFGLFSVFYRRDLQPTHVTYDSPMHEFPWSRPRLRSLEGHLVTLYAVNSSERGHALIISVESGSGQQGALEVGATPIHKLFGASGSLWVSLLPCHAFSGWGRGRTEFLASHTQLCFSADIDNQSPAILHGRSILLGYKRDVDSHQSTTRPVNIFNETLIRGPPDEVMPIRRKKRAIARGIRGVHSVPRVAEKSPSTAGGRVFLAFTRSQEKDHSSQGAMGKTHFFWWRLFFYIPKALHSRKLGAQYDRCLVRDSWWKGSCSSLGP